MRLIVTGVCCSANFVEFEDNFLNIDAQQALACMLCQQCCAPSVGGHTEGVPPAGMQLCAAYMGSLTNL